MSQTNRSFDLSITSQRRSLMVLVCLAVWGTLTVFLDDRIQSHQAIRLGSISRDNNASGGSDETNRTTSFSGQDSKVSDRNLSAVERLALSFPSKPPPFWPDLAMERYKTFHSAEALRNEVQSLHDRRLASRRYAVAYYWCPDRAGNILHNFIWSVAWAVIHNRTLLVEYLEPNLDYNSQSDCEKVMKIHDWIPSVQEFHGAVFAAFEEHSGSIPSIIPVPLDIDRVHYDMTHPLVVYPQIRDIQSLLAPSRSEPSTWNEMRRNTTITGEYIHNSQKLFLQEWSTDPLRYKTYLRALPLDMKTTAGMLYQHGKDYLAGMLLRHSIENLYEHSLSSNTQQNRRMHEGQPPVQNTISASNDKEVSIALHSRHPVLGDDGSFVQQEQHCLEQVLQRHAASESCKVYIMSDRPKTVELLSGWLATKSSSGRDCQVISVDAGQHETTALRLTEHGPYAGRGYWQDWALAGQARTAVVGDPRRSSYMLVKEIIMYDRIVDAYRAYHDVNVSKYQAPLIECELPSKQSSGYTYGPGTPRFAHYSLAAPLEPIRVVQSYKAHHGAYSNGTKDLSKYAVAYFACPLNAQGDGLERFLNDFLLSIATNRTLLWRYWDKESCQRQQGNGCDNNLYEQAACSQVLQRAGWLISYEDFTANYGELPTPHIVNVTDSEDWQEALIVEFPYLNRKQVQRWLTMRDGSDTLDFLARLYELGVEFLYGMLFHEAFELHPNIKESAFDNNVPMGSSDQTTIAYLPSSLGTAKGLECIKGLLGENDERPCHLLLANHLGGPSQDLLNQAKSINCSLWSANQPVEENLSSSSLAYFRQQLLASHARSGYIGPDDSSVALDWIAYKRRLEIWRLGRDPPIIPDFFECKEPDH